MNKTGNDTPNPMMLFDADKIRYQSNIFRNHGLRFLYVLRKTQSSSFPLWKIVLRHMSSRYGLEISPQTSISGGFYLGHAFGITVNPLAVIGSNVNLHKGVTIGQENRGKRKGTPKLGNCVWVGVNATIVGSITIGDDVLIAPNSYVNQDVPSHSIVIGNPCRIIPCQNATEGYVNRLA